MVIGPRDPAMLEVFKMVNSRVVVYQGSQGMKKEYSFVSVFDLVKSIHTLVEQSAPTGDYFSSHPISITYDELLEEIKKNLNVSFTLNVRLPLFILVSVAFGAKYLKKLLPISLPITPDKIAEIKQKTWVCSSNKFIQKFDFKYEDNLQTIVKKTYEDYKQRDWI